MSIWKNFTSLFVRQPKIEKKPDKPNLGASWVSPHGVKNAFPPKESLDAYGEHAYLFAALQRTTEDISALPLKVISGKGKNQKIIENHPAIDLLNNPSSNVDGYLFRQQITLDLILSGTFFVVMLGKGKYPTSLIRLHPDETTFVTDDKQGLKGVKNTSYGQEVYYPIEKILYGRNPSYSKGPKSLYGTGAVQPLYEELRSDINAMMLASEASGKGRPDVLISPTDEADVWPKEVREEIVNSYRQMAKSGGAIALSGMAKIDMLNLSPRDMEYEKARTFARQSISAAIGIPPTILGLPDANYATSLNQKKTYWNNQMHRAKKLDQVYTRLIKLWDINLRVEHSFEQIEALDNRDKALERIALHIANGMSPLNAYNYEGLGDAPISDIIIDDEPEIINDEQKNILLSFFQKNEEKRQKIWSDWIEKKHGPAEKKFMDSSKAYLRRSKSLILSKFRKLKTKSIITIHGEPFTYFEKDIKLTTDMITNTEKKNLINNSIGKTYKKIYIDNAYEELNSILKEADEEEEDFPIEDDELNKSISILGTMLLSTTLKTVNRLIRQGSADGMSANEIENTIKNSSIFGDSRAETIARTETTKVLNNSKMAAMTKAEAMGIPLQKIWVSEKDDKVRPAHVALDGQEIDIDQKFVVPSGVIYAGSEADFPAGFGVEGLDINCRCTMLTEIKRL
tara:strand:+ start:109 stop:2157 length:2049 start_codon:yes stop_codon:yes gene_type:complete